MGDTLLTYRDIKENNPEWTHAMIEDYMSLKREVRAAQSNNVLAQTIAYTVGAVGKLKAMIASKEAPQTNIQQAVKRPINNSMKFKGTWTQRNYTRNDVVFDQGWLMSAKRSTDERAAPYISLSDAWLTTTQGTPSLLAGANAGTVYTGARFYAYNNLKVSGYRFYCPDNSGAFTYELWRHGSQYGLVQLIAPHVPISTGWIDIDEDEMLLEGFGHYLILVTKAASQPTSFVYSWNTVNSDNDPATGTATLSEDGTEIKVHHNDSGGTSRQASLESVAASATLVINSLTWTVLSKTNNANHVTYEVAANKGRPFETLYSLAFSWGSVVNAPYVYDLNYWASTTNIYGFIGTAYPVAGLDNNLYGVDVLYSTHTKSDDWDIVETSGKL